MTITRKKRSLREGFAGFDTMVRETLIGRPAAWLAGARKKMQDLPKTNFDLGCDFAESGRWLDAMFRFKLALWLQPNFAQAWYNLGCCYMKLRKHAKARQAFLKTLSLKPNHTEAAFMLSSLDPSAVPPNLRPTRMIKHTVIDFFTQLAPYYDGIMQQNRYAGPQLMFDTIKPLLKNTNGLHVLDLGCGSGLLARSWRTLAVEVTGADFCPAMVTVATAARVADKPLFDRVIEDDILDMKEGILPARSADVVLLGDTAQFLGDLAPAFALVSRTLKPGGLFGMTYEPFGAPAGYAVNAETGRFGHHPDYVKKTAQQAGLEFRQETKVNLYPGMATPLIIFSAKEGA